MELLDLTLPTPADNLALDEALLDQAESDGREDGLLRLWEPSDHFVVVGRSTRVAQEVNLAACRDDGIPVLRRCSGGAAVVAGPGCLMYAVVISYRRHPQLKSIGAAHQFVLERVESAVSQTVAGVRRQGISDLTIGAQKFSGNSLRCKRDHFLYHGTLLYDYPLAHIAQYLNVPPRQPEYRGGRGHLEFVRNLPSRSDLLRHSLTGVWQADRPRSDWPRQVTRQLSTDRYQQASWNLRL